MVGWPTPTQRPRRCRPPVHLLSVCLAAILAAGCSGSATAGASPSPGPVAGTGPSTAATHAPLTGRVAFAGAADDGHAQIYVQRADGSKVHQLVHSSADDVDPAFSPNGQQLVFTRRVEAQPDRIFVVNVDGSDLRQIVASHCADICGDAVEGSGWSPDGRTLAFTRSIFHGDSADPTNIELWLMDVDGSAARRLTHQLLKPADGQPGAQDNFASWSPDGQRLVFTHWVHATPGGLNQFVVNTIKPDGTDLRAVSPNDVNGGEPVWSPDGSLIAFQSPPDREGVPKGIYTIRPDGTDMSSLTIPIGSSDSDHPTWSPDSRQIAFSHVRDGSASAADLYVVNRDGSQLRRIASTALNETAPSWGVAPP